jgi:hypothetical protein
LLQGIPGWYNAARVFKGQPDYDEPVGVSVTRSKWKLVAALAVAGVIAAALIVGGLAGDHHRGSDPRQGAGVPNLQPAQPHLEVPLGPGEIPAHRQIQNVMDVWRQAIIAKQADKVLECDRIFQDAPAKFSDPLRYSALNDSEDRVRAFSTRVLGKLRDPANAQLFRDLLKDPHQFVRSNAAWGLGQLGGESNLAVVDQIRREDHDEYVRNAAAEALRDGSKPRRR